MAALSCHVGHTAGRDATYFALCKASLPPKYLVRVLGGTGGLCAIPGTVSHQELFQMDKDSHSGLLQIFVLCRPTAIDFSRRSETFLKCLCCQSFYMIFLLGSKAIVDKFENESAAGQPSQIVAVGIACPTPSLPSNLCSATVVVFSAFIPISIFELATLLKISSSFNSFD